MNIEQTKEAIRIMQAFVDGKEVISMRASTATADDPYWNWGNDTKMYRIKPTPVLRPWTADEVPVGGQIRSKHSRDYRFLIDRTANAEVREDWLEHNEHSTDGGKTWKECGVMEEAK
jgi:hypothetical protein